MSGEFGRSSAEKDARPNVELSVSDRRGVDIEEEERGIYSFPAQCKTAQIRKFKSWYS